MSGIELELRAYRHRLPPREHRVWTDVAKYPFLLVKCYFQRIAAVCQWRFMLFLVVSQMVVKGLLYRIAMTAMLPIFKDLGVEVADFQTLMSVAMAPWTIKPLIGVLSDVLTVGGYHKRWWLVTAILTGMASAAFMFPAARFPYVLLLCFTGVNYEMAIVDLLTEGKYAAKMQKYPESGSDLITFVTGLQTVGSIVAMSFVGHVADQKMYWVLFLISTIAATIPLFPALFGWLPERRARASACVGVDRGLFARNRAMFIVIGITGLSGPVIALLANFTSRIVGLVGAGLLLTASVGGSYLAFPRVIAHIGLYQVLTKLSSPSMSTAMDYFFTANATCLPGGPNFSYNYYISFTGMASALVALLAVWLYQAVFSRWKFRSILIFTTCLVGIGGLSDLFIVLRLNRKLGISDHAFYMIGEAIFESGVDVLYAIPTSLVIAKACPEGAESAVFAFLAGLSNFALMVSELLGATIFHAAGVRKCDFDALWWLILVFHVLTPVVMGIPITWLVPNSAQDESFLNENEPATPRSVLTLMRSEDEGEIEFEQLGVVNI